jgi:aconitate hydratase
MGFFGIDEATTGYLRGTGRSADLCQTVENYYKSQGLWGIPDKGDIDYTEVVELDLSTVKPGLAGPKRPQDRIDLDELKGRWKGLLMDKPPKGYGKITDLVNEAVPTLPGVEALGVSNLVDLPEPPPPLFEVTVDSKGGTKDAITHGSVLIAAITSCTNTSNPSVMLAAGLLAQKANARGLTVNPSVKTSLGPGSRVVTDYLEKTGLQKELDKLGFQTVGYGCTTCIGNSGPLDKGIEDVVKREDIVAASVLSGNRNFEARVHQSIKANFLMSPPLVVAFAIAGTVDIDMTSEPLGTGADGQPVFLADIWPTSQEIETALASALAPEVFRKLYTDFSGQNPMWNEIPSSKGLVYAWDAASTYIQEPPFFTG